MSEDKLDLVDAVVFDTAVSKKLRQVTLLVVRVAVDFFCVCDGEMNLIIPCGSTIAGCAGLLL